MMCEFITEHRARFGVVPICGVLSGQGLAIAPRTFYAWLGRAPSKRSLWDTTITEVLSGYYEPDEKGRRPPESLYGSLKMWAHLRREGVEVARCTVERLMRVNGWQGATRAKKVRTTVSDPAATRAPDLVDRHFKVAAPNELVVADFTYVPMAGGWFAYTAFVIDAYADRIVGWECSTSKETAFVEAAIRQAADFRAREGIPLDGSTIHHSDAGSQYTSVRFGESLLLAGMIPSIGSVGDAYDKASVSYCTSLRRFDASSFVEGASHAFDEPGIAGGGRLVEPFILAVGLVGDEESGPVPGFDGGGADAESVGCLGEGEQAPGLEPFGVAGQLMSAA
ncbi:hypothetical protein BH23ACT5_BH23ACT5_00850 [soil metagenome]